MLVLIAPGLEDFLEVDDPELLISPQHLADLYFDIERLHFFLFGITRLILIACGIKIAVPAARIG